MAFTRKTLKDKFYPAHHNTVGRDTNVLGELPCQTWAMRMAYAAVSFKVQSYLEGYGNTEVAWRGNGIQKSEIGRAVL